MFCSHCSESSGRMTCLFLSRDMLEKESHKCRDRMMRDLRRYEDAKDSSIR